MLFDTEREERGKKDIIEKKGPNLEEGVDVMMCSVQFSSYNLFRSDSFYKEHVQM